MRTKLILFGVFGLGINAFLYFQGGWMPMLFFAAIASIVVALFLPGDNSTDI
ncbi:MAG: hypothetical protein K8R23_19630 [Chthoniobacter sp.]|nr:hypothetical protein [Chthoniobacter sp.]